jgi:maleylpyruvate isomerase
MSDVLAAAVADSSARVLAVAEGLDEATLRSSSQLPNWSVGNVLAHIALNAEAFTRVAEERRAGRPGVMYPDGVPGRNADIAELGDAPAAVLIARLSDAIAHFAEAWAEPVPVGPCVTAVGMNEFSSVEVIARRLREVEVHGSDTGLETLNHTTWSDAFVTDDLPNQWATVVRRTDTPLAVIDETGTTWSTEPGVAPLLTINRRDLLAWTLDRITIASLPTLITWGDQSRWR